MKNGEELEKGTEDRARPRVTVKLMEARRSNKDGEAAWIVDAAALEKISKGDGGLIEGGLSRIWSRKPGCQIGWEG